MVPGGAHGAVGGPGLVRASHTPICVSCALPSINACTKFLISASLRCPPFRLRRISSGSCLCSPLPPPESAPAVSGAEGGGVPGAAIAAAYKGILTHAWNIPLSPPMSLKLWSSVQTLLLQMSPASTGSCFPQHPALPHPHPPLASISRPHNLIPFRGLLPVSGIWLRSGLVALSPEVWS